MFLLADTSVARYQLLQAGYHQNAKRDEEDPHGESDQRQQARDATKRTPNKSLAPKPPFNVAKSRLSLSAATTFEFAASPCRRRCPTLFSTTTGGSKSSVSPLT